MEQLRYPPISKTCASSWCARAIRSNIGAAARAMEQFRAFHLGVVTPYEKAFREAGFCGRSRAASAKAEEHNSVEDAVRDCSLVIGTTAIGHRELQ